MAKKIFVQNARLVQGKKWYIEFYTHDATTGAEQRHRKDFDLNKIDNIEVRQLVGERICAAIPELVNFAPAQTTAPGSSSGPTLEKAVQQALDIKLTSPRKNTHKGYKYITNRFLEWAKSRHYSGMPVEQFTKKHAVAYWDYLRGLRKYTGTTLNNYLIHLRAIWGELTARELVATNPFSGLKPARQSDKARRPFNQDEKIIVARRVEQTQYWLYRALLLQYYCYIRPVEIARLKFKAFNFDRGTVTIESYEAKKWKRRTVTIPGSALHYFTDGIFNQKPPNYYIYGLMGNNTVGPSPKPANEQRMYRNHKKILEQLHKEGQLADITGLHWYSWKDTGITRHAQLVTPLATQSQAGHSDFNMTLKYYGTPDVNQEYQEITHDL